MPNSLYYGDNLQVLRDHIPDESVDLVTWTRPSTPTPPSGPLPREAGEESPAQIKAFTYLGVDLGERIPQDIIFHA